MDMSDSTLEILFFGRVADLVGRRALTLPLKLAPQTLFGLRESLFSEMDYDIKTLRMSVNQVVVLDDQPLKPGDEIAFFSVFSGG